MICEKCTQLKTISLCTDSLIIGYVGLYNFGAPYIIYFKSLATGAIYSYAVTSDSNGFITLIFNDGFPLGTGTAYEMWVNKAGDSIDTQEDLTIGVATASCFNLSAETVYNIYYDFNQNFNSQTLEIAD